MLLLAFAGASAILPLQVSGSGVDWVSPDDYPPAALKNSESGYISFVLIFDPAGRPARCQVTVGSGFRDLDALTCQLLMQRAHLRPARDDQGAPAYGVYHSAVSWFAGSNMAAILNWQKLHPPPAAFDLKVTATQLPKKTKSPVDVVVGVLVAKDGAVEGCGSKHSDISGGLEELACREALQSWKPITAVGRSGEPVASVQTVTVRFESGG